jgi:hypothetical protein
MTSISEKIDADLVVALKAREQIAVDTLRGLKSEITRREKDSGQALNEVEILKVIAKELSKRDEAQKMYADAGRDELATKEATEAVLLKGYLPESISDADLESIINEAISTVGAKDIKQMGAVMSIVMEKTKGSANGKTVSELVRSKLSA